MRLDVLSIFPEYLDPLRHALLGKAIERGQLQVAVHDLRDWATDVHKSVDDTPFGGGPGMVMKPGVWGPALDDVARGAAAGQVLDTAAQHVDTPRHDELAGISAAAYHSDAESEERAKPLLIVPTPAGEVFTQQMAREWSTERHVVFACGRYEGIDQRVVDDAARRYRVREVSIGDYVLIGGEVAALVIAEAIVRLIPGVLGNQRSHQEDSFSDGLLEGPSYTKPRTWRGLEVPPELTSGDHGRVDRWRRDQALLRTQARRPELLESADVELTEEDRAVLAGRARTRLTLLVAPDQWERALRKLPKQLRVRGVLRAAIATEELGITCEAEDMLSNQYQAAEGHPPITETRIQLTVDSVADAADTEVTQRVVAALVAAGLRRDLYWYGTTDRA